MYLCEFVYWKSEEIALVFLYSVMGTLVDTTTIQTLFRYFSVHFLENAFEKPTQLKRSFCIV